MAGKIKSSTSQFEMPPVFMCMLTCFFVSLPGPRGVLNLTYRSQDSTVWWTLDPPLESYLYQLSFDNDTEISSGLVSEPLVHLPGLTSDVAYKLVVWAECGGQWQSEPALLCFVAADVPVGPGDVMEGQSNVGGPF